MTAMPTLVKTEFRLLRRDVAAIVLPVVLPLGLLVGFGSASGFHEPDPELGGMSPFDTFVVPVALVLVITLMAIQVFPVGLATYRERGVLRRFATTPVHPFSLLAAQMLVHAGVVAVSLMMTAVVARLAYDVSTPRQPGLALLLLVLGALSLYAMGTAIAALAPRASTATAYAMGAFFPQLLLGGLMVPAEQLPDELALIGELTPVGAMLQGVQEAWASTGIDTLHLAVLAVWTVVAVTVSTLRFRWD